MVDPTRRRLARGETVDEARLDELLDVRNDRWDRTIRRLTRQFRQLGIRLDIPPSTVLSHQLQSTHWTELYREQVLGMPRMDRAAEFRAARRYEFCRARLADALALAGYHHDEIASLVGRSTVDLPPPPRRASEAAIEHVRRCIDDLQAVRNRFVEGSLHIVLATVYRYRGFGVDEVDLIQEGNASLFQAVDGFDWRRDVRFRTYAQYWVQQAILKALYDSARTVRIPVWVHKAYRKIRRAQQRLELPDGADAPVEAVARSVGMPAERVEEILGVRRGSVSLDSTVDAAGEVSLGQLLADETEPRVPDSIDEGALPERLDELLHELPDRHRLILSRRFGLYGAEPETLAEIAADLGITAERVRQLQNAALSRLQSPRRIARLRELGVVA